MEGKVKMYCVSYASFNVEDNEVYCQTLAMFKEHQEAVDFLNSQYDNILNDDFGGHDFKDLNIKRCTESFWIDDDNTYITMKIDTIIEM